MRGIFLDVKYTLLYPIDSSFLFLKSGSGDMRVLPLPDFQG